MIMRCAPFSTWGSDGPSTVSVPLFLSLLAEPESSALIENLSACPWAQLSVKQCRLVDSLSTMGIASPFQQPFGTLT